MQSFVKAFALVYLVLAFHGAAAQVAPGLCQSLLERSKSSAPVKWASNKAIDTALDLMAIRSGLPKYLKLIEELKRTGRYLEYANFGELGLAELGVSVRFNQENLASLNNGRPLIIIANHPLGIADGLALQYLAGLSRTNTPSVLYLARWVEKILPFAVFGDEHHWGTAIPIEINLPKKSDPDYESKLAAVREFNSPWNRTTLRVLKSGGALVVFPAGHVASFNDGGGDYPQNVYDAPDSWQDGFLNLARISKADLVFAQVDSVNSEAFYRDRKRFGGGDKERVIWFFKEALAKKAKRLMYIYRNP